MVYKNFKDKKLSALGFGCMRFPTIDGDNAKIDEAQAAAMIDHAYKNGVNYFDTAYGYHGGTSEAFIGKTLAKYPRDSYYLATKFPGYDVTKHENVAATFEEQLESCGVDYFDFYLCHNLSEVNIKWYLDPGYGLLEYLKEQKENGRIRHLGVSVHCTHATFGRFLDMYGEVLDFAMLQLNYIDYDFQGAKIKIDMLKERGLPVWVMEPLRGGRLAIVQDEEMAKFEAMRPGENAPSWGFNFVRAIPEVTMILSGMSTMEQVKDNLRIFSEDKPLTEAEFEAVREMAKGIVDKVALPCTFCQYCVPLCPKGLNIPYLLELYNEHMFTSSTGKVAFLAPMSLRALPEEKHPKGCIGCRKCEPACPQYIEIAKAMKDFDAKLNPPQ